MTVKMDTFSWCQLCQSNEASVWWDVKPYSINQWSQHIWLLHYYIV